MDDETSSRYIVLFTLLLIPFLVIGLSFQALINNNNATKHLTINDQTLIF